MLVNSGIDMAARSRTITTETIVHADHGPHFTAWALARRAQQAGLLPSLDTVGDPYDSAVIESFWGRMQVELLKRRRWNTHSELANAMFENSVGFRNPRRRHN